MIDMKKQPKNHLMSLTQSAFFTALICICSVITIPNPISFVPFTLQTFAIFLCGLLLKRRYSLVAVVTYVLLGCAGLPVFSSFKSGLGTLLGPTGGFILGFLPGVYTLSTLTKICRKKGFFLKFIFPMSACLFWVYFLGALWFKHLSQVTFFNAVLLSVFPYIFGDVVKAIVALWLYRKIIQNRSFHF